MPRSPRLDFSGARHHVMNRGARRSPMFHTDRDCALFVDLLSELPERFDVRIHGYALMPNHYHLMVESVRGNLSEAMRHLGAVFTQRLNRMHPEWDGPIFRGRFHNELVDDDAYWRHLLAYLHLNPVKARLATRPEQSIWSSHEAYAGEVPTPEWLTTDELIGQFGGVEPLLAYIEDVRLKRIGAPEGFDPERFFRTPTTVAPAPEPRPVVSPEEALADVLRVTGASREEVMTRPRGRSANPIPWLAIWWLLRATRLSQKGVADLLRVSRGRVGQLNQRVMALARSDAQVRAWMTELDESLKMPLTRASKV